MEESDEISVKSDDTDHGQAPDETDSSVGAARKSYLYAIYTLLKQRASKKLSVDPSDHPLVSPEVFCMHVISNALFPEFLVQYKALLPSGSMHVLEKPNQSRSALYIDLDVKWKTSALNSADIQESIRVKAIELFTIYARDLVEAIAAAMAAAPDARYLSDPIVSGLAANSFVIHRLDRERADVIGDGSSWKCGIHGMLMVGMCRGLKKEIMTWLIEKYKRTPTCDFCQFVSAHCVGTFPHFVTEIVDEGASVYNFVPLLGSRKKSGTAGYVLKASLVFSRSSTEAPFRMSGVEEQCSQQGKIEDLSVNNQKIPFIPLRASERDELNRHNTANLSVNDLIGRLVELTTTFPDPVGLIYQLLHTLPAIPYATEHNKRHQLIRCISNVLKDVIGIENPVDVGALLMFEFIYTSTSDPSYVKEAALRHIDFKGKSFSELREKFIEVYGKTFNGEPMTIGVLKMLARKENPAQYEIISSCEKPLASQKIYASIAKGELALGEDTLSQLLLIQFGEYFRARDCEKPQIYKYTGYDMPSQHKWIRVNNMEVAQIKNLNRIVSIVNSEIHAYNEKLARGEFKGRRRPQKSLRSGVIAGAVRMFAMNIAAENTRFYQQLDADPHATGVRNGVLQFTEEECLEPGTHKIRVTPSLIQENMGAPYVSKSAGANYLADLSEESPSVIEVRKKLADILDPEELEYLLRHRSLCLNNEMCNGKLVQLFGAGRDGKSTIMLLHANAFGAGLAKENSEFSYAASPSSAIFASSPQDPNAHTSGYMPLKGARYAYISDPNEEASQRGRSVITASGLKNLITYGETRTFRSPNSSINEVFGITAQFETATNVVIMIPSINYGTARRLVVIPFQHRFVSKRELEVLDNPSFRLEDTSMSTNWVKRQDIIDAYFWILVKYYIEVRANGWDVNTIPQPATIKKYTENYITNSDSFGTFIKFELRQMTREERESPAFAGYEGIKARDLVNAYLHHSLATAADEKWSPVAIFNRFKHGSSIEKFFTGDTISDAVLNGFVLVRKVAAASGPAPAPEARLTA